VIVSGDSIFSDTYSVAILDTGTSFTYVPYNEMTNIATYMADKFGSSNFGCYTSDGDYLCLF
jgi:hypothetical protein